MQSHLVGDFAGRKQSIVFCNYIEIRCKLLLSCGLFSWRGEELLVRFLELEISEYFGEIKI